LYFLLSGRTPFPGGGAEEKVQRLVREAPEDLKRLRPELPGPLVDVVRRMMGRSPGQRGPAARGGGAALAPPAAAGGCAARVRRSGGSPRAGWAPPVGRAWPGRGPPGGPPAGCKG